jgi:DNA-binding transcriptional regulator/RsmH inhibitor MraZ
MPGEVMVIGARNRLEVHARGGWQASMKDRFREMAALIERSERNATDARRGEA